MGTSSRTYPPFVLLATIFVVALTLVPLVFVVVYTISTGWDVAWQLLVRRRVGELLWNTVRLVIGCMTLSAIIGIGAAWLVERTTLPLRRLWNALLVAPLAVPAFVNSYGWVSVTSAVEGYGGALLIVTLSYYPFVYLPVAAALRGLDPALEETSHSLGASKWQTFVRVILPQLKPALFGGALLVGLHLLAEFGALQMLRFPTFTTAIYDQYSSTFNGSAANMLASVLAVLCLLLLVGELKVVGRSRYSRVGSGAARERTRAGLGLFTLPALLSLLALTVLALGVPIASLIHWLIAGTSTAFPFHELIKTTSTSVMLGVAAALLASVCALPVAWLKVRHRGALSTALERGAYFGSAFPGIVIALALITASIKFAQPIYQTTLLLLCAYVIMFLPRALVSSRAALAQAPPLYDDIASALGASRLSTWRRVTIPIIAPGLGAGAALVFMAVVTELTSTLLLAPIGTETLATEFWDNSSSVAYGAAAPYAALMVLISLPATYLLTREASKSSIE